MRPSWSSTSTPSRIDSRISPSRSRSPRSAVSVAARLVAMRVERPPELRDLVAARRPQAHREIARRHPARGVGHPAQRARQHLRDRRRGDQGDHQRDEQRAPQDVADGADRGRRPRRAGPRAGPTPRPPPGSAIGNGRVHQALLDRRAEAHRRLRARRPAPPRPRADRGGSRRRSRSRGRDLGVADDRAGRVDERDAPVRARREVVGQRVPRRRDPGRRASAAACSTSARRTNRSARMRSSRFASMAGRRYSSPASSDRMMSPNETANSLPRMPSLMARRRRRRARPRMRGRARA